jgi:hypothetical protein
MRSVLVKTLRHLSLLAFVALPFVTGCGGNSLEIPEENVEPPSRDQQIDLGAPEAKPPT